MSEITRAIDQVLTDGAVQGAAAFALLAGLLWFWVHILKKIDFDNDIKRFMSGAAILVVIFAAYGYGLATGREVWSDDRVFHALRQVPIAYGFMQAIFLGTKPLSNALKRRRVRLAREKAALVAVTTPPVVVQPAPLPPVVTPVTPAPVTPFVPDPADE